MLGILPAILTILVAINDGNNGDHHDPNHGPNRDGPNDNLVTQAIGLPPSGSPQIPSLCSSS
jgi:hypothetical protein